MADTTNSTDSFASPDSLLPEARARYDETMQQLRSEGRITKDIPILFDTRSDRDREIIMYNQSNQAEYIILSERTRRWSPEEAKKTLPSLEILSSLLTPYDDTHIRADFLAIVKKAHIHPTPLLYNLPDDEGTQQSVRGAGFHITQEGVPFIVVDPALPPAYALSAIEHELGHIKQLGNGNLAEKRAFMMAEQHNDESGMILRARETLADLFTVSVGEGAALIDYFEHATGVNPYDPTHPSLPERIETLKTANAKFLQRHHGYRRTQTLSGEDVGHEAKVPLPTDKPPPATPPQPDR